MRSPTSDRGPQRLRTITTIVVTALIIAPAAALATHSFNDVGDGDFFHAAVDWMKDNGVTVGCNPSGGNTNYCPDDFVTRGEMAVFLERLDSEDVFLRPGDVQLEGGDADTLDGKDSAAFLGASAKAADAGLLDGKDSTAFLPSSGETIIQFRDWDPSSPGVFTTTESSGVFQIRSGSLNTGSLIADPDLPKQLFGVTMAVKQFDLCYTTRNGAMITAVQGSVFAENGDTFGTAVEHASDFTDRTDDACRTHSFSSPVPLTTDRYFHITVSVNVGATSARVHLTKATVTLVPA